MVMWAITPLSMRNCSRAESSREAWVWPSSDWTSVISDPVRWRMMSMSCTARSMTTPTSPMRGGKGPTRVIWMEMISSPSMARLTVSTAGLKRSTWPTISTRSLALAASIMAWASATVAAIGFSTST